MSSIACAANVAANRTLSIKEGPGVECGSIDVVQGSGSNGTNCMLATLTMSPT